MGKDLVKYHNDLNKLNMANLKEKELDLFYAICLEIKDRTVEEIVIDIRQFKKDFNISNKVDKKRFKEYIVSVHNKFLEVKIHNVGENIIKSANFFNYFETDLDAGAMKIKVNKDYAYLLNNLTKIYTQFSFLSYQNLSSKYAKLLLPHLMQWNSQKEKYFEKEELFNLLNIPNSYRNKIVNFNDKVLKPCLKELKVIFYNLKCEKKKINKNEIKGYKFTWEDRPVEKKENEEIEIITEIEISKKMKNAIDFYTNYEVFEILKDEYQVEKMLEEFGEEKSLKILETIFKNNKNNKIESFEYFRKINKKIKTFKIIEEPKKNVENEKLNQEELFEKIEKIKLNQKEYDILFEKEYKKHLKKINASDNEILKRIFKIQFKTKYELDIFKDIEEKDIIQEPLFDKKIYTIDDIPKEELLSKSGKKLSGIALKYKIEKILKKMNS